MYFWKSNLENLFFQGAISKTFFFFETVISKINFLREQFWKRIFWGNNFENVFLKTAVLNKYFLRTRFSKCIFKNVVFEGAMLKIYFLREQFWKSLMKNNFVFNTHFFNKCPSTFVWNSCYEKESLKIRKVTSKTG